MQKITHFLSRLFKSFAKLCLFFILAGAISYGIGELQKEHYAPTDTPNAKFRINGQRLQDIKDNPTKLQTEPTPIENCMDSCLKILENGNYLYINEGALQTTYSEYQIDGDIVIPVSFERQNFGHFVIAMFLAFLMLSFLKYLHAIYKIRKDKNSLIAYHKKLGKELLIFMGIVGIGWGLILTR
ncbi:hypothetical protein [Moraxella bovis]|uniref:Uncharacterized protein n=1 Tax=Moraxella bovis TaxID=476 RepID=A0A2Z4R7G8_MORBO|nr:hypothetical protein [Moraxella bovis]AWY20527.1 hypothetical protein DQF64_08495 [Moraxella bovis]UYZ76796.1 hypothetical protein LP093_05805 [Moraxella bovis]UYZ77249.1 hypothetical protein LP115_08010 [Moraxella bovis]UYZ82268.1 hypothetical protein LP113_06120 [Moraxella bovis]UYZ85736.1 hypothetical protein LP094_08055 [Moraxella bovis]